MTKSATATPDQIKTAVAMRESGYSLASISDKTKLSPSTLYRAFKRLTVSKGGVTAEMVEDARMGLFNDALFDSLKFQVAASILDDLAIARKMREVMLLALDELEADKKTPAALKSRSLAAFATVLKITQEVSRKSLRLDSTDNQILDDMPELVVAIMTDEEIDEAKNKAKEDEWMETDDIDE